jgi:hypothetical protein
VQFGVFALCSDFEISDEGVVIWDVVCGFSTKDVNEIEEFEGVCLDAEFLNFLSNFLKGFDLEVGFQVLGHGVSDLGFGFLLGGFGKKRFVGLEGCHTTKGFWD